MPSRASSWPRDPTWVSCIAGRFFTVWASRAGQNPWLITMLPGSIPGPCSELLAPAGHQVGQGDFFLGLRGRQEEERKSAAEMGAEPFRQPSVHAGLRRTAAISVWTYSIHIQDVAGSGGCWLFRLLVSPPVVSQVHPRSPPVQSVTVAWDKREMAPPVSKMEWQEEARDQNLMNGGTRSLSSLAGAWNFLQRPVIAFWPAQMSRLPFFLWIETKRSVCVFRLQAPTPHTPLKVSLGKRCGSPGKELTCEAGDARDAGSIPGLRKSPWRRAWQPTPVFLPGKFQATVRGIAKSRTWLSTRTRAHAHTEHP